MFLASSPGCLVGLEKVDAYVDHAGKWGLLPGSGSSHSAFGAFDTGLSWGQCAEKAYSLWRDKAESWRPGQAR